MNGKVFQLIGYRGYYVNGGKTMAGKRGTKYRFPEKMRDLPMVTWRNKSLREMNIQELRNATRYLVAGWEAALSPQMLYVFTGLDEERIEELKRRDPQLASIEYGSAERLVAIARVNLSRSIQQGNIKDSRWLLEHVDTEFQPASKLSGEIQQVLIPVEEKEKLIEAEMDKVLEGVEVEFHESTESVTGESED